MVFCSTYYARSGKWTPNSRSTSREDVVEENLIISNTTAQEEPPSNLRTGRSGRRRDFIDAIRKVDLGEKDPSENVKEDRVVDRMKIGSMVEIKIDLEAADDEENITSL
jgi:hypothetical protein